MWLRPAAPPCSPPAAPGLSGSSTPDAGLSPRHLHTRDGPASPPDPRHGGTTPSSFCRSTFHLGRSGL